MTVLDGFGRQCWGFSTGSDIRVGGTPVKGLPKPLIYAAEGKNEERVRDWTAEEKPGLEIPTSVRVSAPITSRGS